MAQEPRRGARSVYLTGVAAAFALLGDSALYAVLPATGASLGLSGAEVGLLLSVNRILRLGLNEPAGWLVERAGPGGPLVLALVLAAATTWSYGHATGVLGAFVALRIAWGLAWSFIRHASNAAVLGSSPSRGGELLGSFRSLSRLGSLAAVLGTGALVDEVGFARAYELLALATLPGIAVAAAAFARGRGPSSPPSELAPVARGPDDVAPGDAAPGDPTPGPASPALPPAPAPPGETASLARFAFATGASALVHAAGTSLLLSTASLSVRELAGDNSKVLFLGVPLGLGALGGLATAGRFAGEIGAPPVAGALADRLGPPRLVALGGLAGALGLALCALAREPGRFALAAVGTFLALAVLLAALDALAAHDAALARERGPRWLGRYFSITDLGSAVGPFFGPALAGRVGLPPLYGVGAAACLAIALSAASLRRPGSSPARANARTS